MRRALHELQQRLPPGWTASHAKQESLASNIDAIVEIIAPDRRTASIVFDARARLDPKRVLSLLETREARPGGALVVVAPYLSEATRARLRSRDVGYIDLTGNVRIVVPDPGLFIETEGAEEDPDREERPARSLRGAKAGRIVRELVDHKVSPGVRELAAMTGADAGYVSRVLAFLDSEALISRVGHGRVQSVDWPALLRRWAHDAPLESRGEAETYLEPRGLSALLARLHKLRADRAEYAVTGTLAAAAYAPTTPARLATIWTLDADIQAQRLGLRQALAGANVLVIEPVDASVFHGAMQREGVWYAAPSQVAADLLTSPGRGPAEGEELISWMQANEDKWRQ